MPKFRTELTDWLRPKLGGKLQQDIVDWLDAWADRAGVPREDAPDETVAPTPPTPAPKPLPPEPAPSPKPTSPPIAAGGMMTPKALFADFIGTHEGELSVHPKDNGNWYDPARFTANQPQKRGLGVNVGSKYGVTAYALIAYRRRKGTALAQALVVTRETMANLDFDTAVDIGVELYYRQPGFDRLPWNRVTMSVVDKGWGSGPGRAIKLLQERIGASTVGGIGPDTIGKYEAFLKAHGEEEAAHLWAETRMEFDLSLTTNEGPNDPDKAFINGWNNRTRSFLPGTNWWRKAGGEG